MSNKKIGDCRLCKLNSVEMADSHIFSKGFFRALPNYARVESISPNGESLRRLPTALHDKNILCRDCERAIMSPLDNYGIRIFRDKEGAELVKFHLLENLRLQVFEKVDYRTLRAFIASILWRVSVSDLTEIEKIKIGESWEDKIANDLCTVDASFEYIDSLTSFYTEDVYDAFFMPWPKVIEVLDPSRDSDPVNGWVIQLPKIRLFVSLDEKFHPQRMYYSFSPCTNDKNEEVRIHTSLTQHGNDRGSFSCFESDWVFPNMFPSLSKILSE